MRRVGAGTALLLLATAAQARFLEMPLRDKVTDSAVIACVRVEAILPSNPAGRLRHTARVRVIRAVKGTAVGRSLEVDYDTGMACPNVLYAQGEECLVFLVRQPNGRLSTVNYSYGKRPITGDTVQGWLVKRDSHRDVPLSQVLAELDKMAS